MSAKPKDLCTRWLSQEAGAPLDGKDVHALQNIADNIRTVGAQYVGKQPLDAQTNAAMGSAECAGEQEPSNIGRC